MPEINMTTGDRLPGADEPHAPAISFGEGATRTMLDMLRGMDGWYVQITDEHGSYEAMVADHPVQTDDRDIWSVCVNRVETNAHGEINPVGDAFLVPLDRLRRVHVW